MDSAQRLERVVDVRQWLPSSAEILSKEILIGEEEVRDQWRSGSEMHKRIVCRERRCYDDAARVEQPICPRRFGAEGRWIVSAVVRTVLGNPTRYVSLIGGFMLAICAPVPGIVRILAWVACTGMCCSDRVPRELHLQKLIHILPYNHVRVKQYCALPGSCQHLRK